MNDPILSPFAVLYTDDMEPITVLEVPAFARDLLLKHGYVTLQVMPPMPLLRAGATPSDDFKIYTVTIRAEVFVRNGTKHFMLFTRDDVNTMLLRAAFLPGQRGALRNREAEAFAEGFLEALKSVGHRR